MPTIKKLQFANGTDVTEPTDLSLESSTDHLKTYADDAAYVADNGAASAGDIYINTTMNTARLYAGGQWWSVVIKENAIIVDDNFKLLDNGDNTKVGKFDVSNVPTGTTKTYAVPAITTSSDVLVTQDATQELKNKTIDGNLNTLTNLDFGTLSGEVNPQNGGTGISNPAGATLTRTGAFDLNITCTAETDVTMPVSGTLATLTDISASNLTGTVPLTKGGLGTDASAFSGVVKVSGGTASASSIANADISATAAIARSKVASGTANHIVINDGTGVLSSEATLAKSRGGSGQDNTNLTFPSTGTLATLTGLETLSSKTLLENTVDNFLAFNEEAAAPATPSAGKVAVYAKSDSKIYKKDSTGAESEIGAGGSGTGRNYLQDWFDGTKPIGTIINGLTTTGNRSTSGGANLQWGASSTSNMTVTLETVTPLRQTSSIKIDSLNTTSGAFVETPMFLIDNADLGKPLSVEFDIGDIAANTNYDIVVMQYTLSGTYVQTIPVAGNASTGSPSSAQLPTGTTKFRGFFITAGDAGGYYYSLRIRKLAAVDDDFQIDSLFVGPQSLAQGAVVTAWQNYTPTFEGFGTVSSVIGNYRRVGDTIEITGSFISGTPTATTVSISLPSGLNLDPSKIHPTTGQINSLGFINRGNSTNVLMPSTTRGPWSIVESRNISTSKVYIGPETDTDAGGIFLVYNGNSVATSGDRFTFSFSAPISQWSSGTTTLADRAVEEFVSHDGTNIVRGPAGSLVPSVGFSTGVTQFIVDFQQALNATDSFVLEFSRSGLGWQNASDIYPWSAGNNASGLNFYGLRIYKLNATQYAIEFGNQGIRVAISNQSAGAESWANERIAGTRFRLRKVSGGAAVGFPVSARNIVGDTSGTAVPVGMLGEKIDFTPRAVTTASSVYRANLSPLATLTSGIYLIFGTAALPGGTGSTSVTVIATNSNNDSTGFVQTNYTTSNYQTAAAGGIEPMMPGYLVVPANSTQSIYAKAFGDVGTPVVTVGGFAVRIA